MLTCGSAAVGNSSIIRLSETQVGVKYVDWVVLSVALQIVLVDTLLTMVIVVVEARLEAELET